MVVPVYIRDFLGDYTDVSTHSMRKVFNSFTQKYCEDLSKYNIKFYDAISIELVVSEPDFAKTTDEMLSEIQFNNSIRGQYLQCSLKLYFAQQFVSSFNKVWFRNS